MAGQEFLLQCLLQISLSKVKWNTLRGVAHIKRVFFTEILHYQEDESKAVRQAKVRYSFDERLTSEWGNGTDLVLRQSSYSHRYTGFAL